MFCSISYFESQSIGRNLKSSINHWVRVESILRVLNQVDKDDFTRVFISYENYETSLQ